VRRENTKKRTLRARRRRVTSGVTATLVVAALGAVAAPSAGANLSQLGQPAVYINPGGGVQTDGSDGLRIEMNLPAPFYAIGGEQVVYRNTGQYCCTSAAPMLNIGGQLYGEVGPAAFPIGSVVDWTSLSILSPTGSTTTSGGSSTGSGSVTLRYVATKGGLTYTVDRAVSYTYPNDFFSETYTFTIPPGNTDTVKFYMGGDTAPGSSDQGYGVMLTSPVRSVISLNTLSQILFGYREVIGSRAFDGAVARQYNTPYPTVEAGADIGFFVEAADHDAGLMVQWNLGSTPGTLTASMEEFVNVQGTNLLATFGAANANAGSPVPLDFNIVNTQLSTTTGLGFTFALPAGTTIASASPTNGCSGTLTATPGSDTVTLAGGSVGATANCVISVPVIAAQAGTYQITSASVSGLAVLTNGIGTSTFVVDPPAGTPPTWTDSTIGSLQVGVAFADGVSATGTATVTYSVAAGSLPAGLALDTATGAITGTPTAAGPYDFTLAAANSIGTITQQFTGTVAAATPSPPGTPPANVGGGSGDITPELLDDLRAALPTGVEVSAITATPSGEGSWALLPDGGVFTAGDAPFFGSLGDTPLNAEAIGIAATASGNGYWIVTSDGGVFTFGDAAFFGSMGAVPLNQPIVGLTPTCDGRGYYLVAEDGGIFAFGGAAFHGSMGGTALNKGMVGLVPTCSGGGYWTFAADGGVFTFGDATFHGSLGGTELVNPVVGMIPAPTGRGYWLVDSADVTHPFGDVT
jgi:hypothetical protein